VSPAGPVPGTGCTGWKARPTRRKRSLRSRSEARFTLGLEKLKLVCENLSALEQQMLSAGPGIGCQLEIGARGVQKSVSVAQTSDCTFS
jgi:hypothetical protein